MKNLLLTITVLVLSIYTLPVLALECANAGASPETAPDDTGDGDATACGSAAVASGIDSTALGASASAIGNRSTALGGTASSTGNESIALGYFASSAGDSSTALGRSADAGGFISTALGYFASSMGSQSTALGHSARSVGDESTALGYAAASIGNNSTALGYFANSAGPRSLALGYLASAPNADTVVLGAIDGVNFATSYSDVAIGTTAPLVPLHVKRADGTAGVMVEEANEVVAPRTLLTLANPGNTKFEIINTDVDESWAFTNSGIDFRMSLQGSGVVEFRVDNNGNAYTSGLLFELSDRNAKTNITPVDTEAVLKKVAAMPINQWAYKGAPDTSHIGPMAQDFREAFGTGMNDTTLATMDAVGVAIASIQALEKRNSELERKNAAVVKMNSNLEERVALLEAALGSSRNEPAGH